jgi:hypothetical protein
LNLSNYEYIPIAFESWYGMDIEKIKNFIEINNCKYQNIIYYFKNNTRIYLIDLYNYDIINKTSYAITILHELNKSYYLKNSKIPKEKGIINIYLRYGDLRNIKHKTNIVVNNDFEINTLTKLSNELNMQNFTVNLISAGEQSDLQEIKNDFKKFNKINFLFNMKQEEVFHLMTQSDYLIFSESSFPFTASLYCDGQIYICKNTFCMIPYLFYDIKYLSNYHIM